MTRSSNTVSDAPLVSPQAADDHVYRTIGLFIGQNRRFSVYDIETGTGIPNRTVSAWIANTIENRRRPKAAHLLILMQFLGLEFTNKVLGAIGQGGRSLNAQEDTASSVIAKLVRGASDFAELGADGEFCHVDRAKLETPADMLIATLVPFSTRGRA